MNIVNSFYECISNDFEIPSDFELLRAFFGKENMQDVNILTIIYGVYRGLYLKGIEKDLLYKCYISNNLDKLIHKKYSHRKSAYYLDFVDKNIEIGKTYADNNEIEIDLLNEDHCLSCYSEGYYTNKNYNSRHNIFLKNCIYHKTTFPILFLVLLMMIFFFIILNILYYIIYLF